jgi:hypothetical protein
MRASLAAAIVLTAACSQTAPARAPLFEFHSDPWLGLHQRLMAEAAISQRTPAPTCLNAPPWADAVVFYREHFRGKDPIFDDELIDLNLTLARAENASSLSGEKLSPELERVLEPAFAVYGKEQWPADDAKNRTTSARAEKLIEPFGAELADELALRLEAVWPSEPIRVELSPIAGWAPAYTTPRPILVTLANADPRNDGDALLELLFHEASHGMSDVLDHDLISAFMEQGKKPPDGLDHAILFYTAGELVRRHLGARYVPYAYQRGLYQHGWQRFEPALRGHWQPWLDGAVALRTAVAGVARAL